MVPSEIYVKTAKGLEEVRSLKDSLAPGARVTFFMVDGLARADEILAQLSGLGVTAEVFDQLIAWGFIAPGAPPPPPPSAGAEARTAERAAPVEIDRFFPARKFMNETVVNAAGLRSFFFTLKLEKANSLRDLRLLLVDYSKLIEKGTGALEAEVLVRRARELTQEGAPPGRGEAKSR